MSDNFARPYDDNDGVTKQAVHSRHQSVWMSHWMTGSSCKAPAKQDQGRLSICYESQEEDDRDTKQHCLLDTQEKVENTSKDENRACEIAETRLIGTVDESVMFKPDNLRSSFPMFNLHRKGDNALAQKLEQPSSSHWISLKSQTDHDMGYQLLSLGGGETQLRKLPPMVQWVHDAKSPSRGNALKPECFSESQEEEGLVEDNKFSTERSIKSDFSVSSSKVLPYGFNYGKTLVRPVGKQEETNRSNSLLESGVQVTDIGLRKNSMFLAPEDSVKRPGRSWNPSVGHNAADLLPRDPSTSRSQQPEFVAKQYHKVQEHNGMQLFRSDNHHVELTKSENLHCASFPLPSLQEGPSHGMRACTTVDAMEESSGGCKKFSTTHHFLLTKTDLNMIHGGSVLNDSKVATKLNEKYSSELFPFDQDNAFPIKTGLKLQLLGSSEEEKDARDFTTASANIRNETSSETNTMDLDTFRKNHVSGIASLSSNKPTESEQRSSMSQAALNPSREVGGKLQKAMLPDINHLPNDLTGYENSPDTSTSRTQSLEAEQLVLNFDQPENFKRNSRSASCLECEPSRWVKRLKLSSNSGCGTRSSKMGEDSSHEKVNNIFSKIMKFSLTSSDPITGRSCGKEPIGLDQGTTLRNEKSPSIDSVRKNREVTLSHPWVRRLCHNTVSPQEKSKAVVGSEPQFSKESIDKRQKKQLPSLAAMALMGKGIGSFNSCQFRRNGLAVVWNS